jgi:hypothetical protein
MIDTNPSFTSTPRVYCAMAQHDKPTWQPSPILGQDWFTLSLTALVRSWVRPLHACLSHALCLCNDVRKPCLYSAGPGHAFSSALLPEFLPQCLLSAPNYASSSPEGSSRTTYGNRPLPYRLCRPLVTPDDLFLMDYGALSHAMADNNDRCVSYHLAQRLHSRAYTENDKAAPPAAACWKDSRFPYITVRRSHYG